MRTKVYFAGKPCVQTVATAMARFSKQNCEPLPPSYMPENLITAFIGSSDKGGKAVKEVFDFINIIDNKRVGRVALYATSPSGNAASVIDSMRVALKARGIPVMEESFSCYGKGTIGGKMPSDAELRAAEEFVARIEAIPHR